MPNSFEEGMGDYMKENNDEYFKEKEAKREALKNNKSEAREEAEERLKLINEIEQISGAPVLSEREIKERRKELVEKLGQAQQDISRLAFEYFEEGQSVGADGDVRNPSGLVDTSLCDAIKKVLEDLK